MRDTILYITGSENDRKYAKILFEAGDMVYEGKYKEAEKLYNEALKYNKEAYYYLGTLYYNYYKNKNKAIESITTFNSMLSWSRIFLSSLE